MNLSNCQNELTTLNQRTSLGQAADLLSGSAQVISATADAITKVSEGMSSREEKFLSDHQSAAGQMKLHIIEEAASKGEIAPELAVKLLSEAQEANTSETERLLKAHADAERAHSETARNIGVGVGVAGLGIGGVAIACSQIRKIFS